MPILDSSCEASSRGMARVVEAISSGAVPMDLANNKKTVEQVGGGTCIGRVVIEAGYLEVG